MNGQRKVLVKLIRNMKVEDEIFLGTVTNARENAIV